MTLRKCQDCQSAVLKQRKNGIELVCKQSNSKVDYTSGKCKFGYKSNKNFTVK